MGALYGRVGRRVTELMPDVSERDRAAVADMLRAGVSCPLSSGMGRLFDALSALLGICRERSYEGHPAIELEAIADPAASGDYGHTPVRREGDAMVLDGPAVLAAALADARQGTTLPLVAARFHNTIARTTVRAAVAVARREGLETVCLSGGTYQNALLTERTVAGLREAGVRPLVHRRVPPNDECISYGQAVIAGARGLS
jgi:hydrogenase maturation protein HypF